MVTPDKPEKYPILHEVLADDKTGHGTFDDGWEPSLPDLNSDEVRRCSEPGLPGIRPKPVLQDFGGILVSRYQAARLGLIDPDKEE